MLQCAHVQMATKSVSRSLHVKMLNFTAEINTNSFGLFPFVITALMVIIYPFV